MLLTALTDGVGAARRQRPEKRPTYTLQPYDFITLLRYTREQNATVLLSTPAPQLRVRRPIFARTRRIAAHAPWPCAMVSVYGPRGARLSTFVTVDLCVLCPWWVHCSGGLGSPSAVCAVSLTVTPHTRSPRVRRGGIHRVSSPARPPSARVGSTAGRDVHAHFHDADLANSARPQSMRMRSRHVTERISPRATNDAPPSTPTHTT